MSEIRDLAAFFDRHGTVSLTPMPSGNLKLRIAIKKASPVHLKRFKAYFGVGTVGSYPQYPPHRYYTYFAYAENARRVLTELAPHLVAKREVVESCLNGQDSPVSA